MPRQFSYYTNLKKQWTKSLNIEKRRQVDSTESPETLEITDMTESFTKITKYLTKLKDMLINYV